MTRLEQLKANMNTAPKIERNINPGQTRLEQLKASMNPAPATNPTFKTLEEATNYMKANNMALPSQEELNKISQLKNPNEIPMTQEYKQNVKQMVNPVRLAGEKFMGGVAQGVANIGNSLYRNFGRRIAHRFNPSPVTLQDMSEITEYNKWGLPVPKKDAKLGENWSEEKKQKYNEYLQREKAIMDYRVLPNTPQYNQMLDKKAENLGNGWKNVYNATGVVGNMIPTVGATLINPTLGNATLFANAEGGAYDEAISKGATPQQAQVNALLSGATELGIEKLSGGLSNKFLGTKSLVNPANLTRKIGNKFVRGAVNTALDVTGEGLEEVASTIVQPIIDRATYNPNAEFATGEEMAQSFKDSILPTLMLGGINKGIETTANIYTKAEQQIDNSNLPAEQKVKAKVELEKAKNQSIAELQAQQEVQEELPSAKPSIANNNTLLASAEINGIKAGPLVESIGKTLNDRGIQAEFNAELFKGSNTNALWTTTTDANGNITRKVIFNPNADTQKTIEQTAIHELTHDLENTEEYQELARLILDKNKTREGYIQGREDLENIYSQVYDINNPNFKQLVDSEEVADTLGQKLGDQQFINELSYKKPNIFKRMYNWVVDKLNNFTGSRYEKLYWADVKAKFENAYRQDYKARDNTKYSIEGINEELKQLREEKSKYSLFSKEGLKIANQIKELETKKQMQEENFKGTMEDFKEQQKLKEQTEIKLKNQKAKAKIEAQIKENGNETQIKEKQKQLEIIKKANPMLDDFHVGIRNVDDIKTFEEAMKDEESFYWGDFEREDAEKALKNNKITIYSSKPIKQGGFVSTSKKQAEEYAGGKGEKIYSKTVSPNEIAWINGDEGQYANTKKSDSEETKKSQKTNEWQKFLDKNIKAVEGKTIKQLKKDFEAFNLAEKPKEKASDVNTLLNVKKEDLKLPEAKYNKLKDEETNNVRKFYENVETSEIVDQEAKDLLEPTTYEVKHNVDTLQKMADKLDTDGTKAVEEWMNKDIKKFTDEDVALGSILVQRYGKNGDFESEARVVEKLADAGTTAGRTVQMYSIFQRMTPEGMQIYLQKNLDQAFENMKKNKTKKWVDENAKNFKLNPEDIEFVRNKMEEMLKIKEEVDNERLAKGEVTTDILTDRRVEIPLAEISKRISEKLPPAKGQGIKALRRISMLGNLKTQVRNVMGNAVITPINTVADTVGTIIDKAIAKKTGVRTTNLPQFKSYAEGIKQGALNTIDDYKKGISTSPTGSRYEINPNSKSFSENTKNKAINNINKKLNFIDNLVGTSLEFGDRPFYEATFKNSLEGQMKANKVDTPTPEMIDIATEEALSRTWNDNNQYTDFVLGVRRAMNKINVGGLGIGDVFIPFAKTPANLTKAIVEYAPTGFIQSAIDYSNMQKAIDRGEFTSSQQKKFVSSMSKAIAGTMLYAIAGALARTGRITGSRDDDKDVSNFERNVLGIQPYSVKIGDKTYSYNWANPVSAPLAIMADTYKMSKENEKLSNILLNAIEVGGEQLLENSFLQSIAEVFKGKSLMEGVGEQLLETPAQFIPTALGQVATQFDKTKRQSFEYGNKLETTKNQIKNKIPGLKNTLAPQVNTFGEEIENYGGDNNPFNVFLNPANIDKARPTKTQKELYSLYEATKDKTIFPRQAPYYFSNGTEKIELNSHDRAKYQKESGKYVSKNLEELFASEYYQGLSNEDKIDMINKILDDSTTVAKDLFIDNQTTDRFNKLKKELKGVPMVDYYIAYNSQKGIEGDKNIKGKTISGSVKKNKIKAFDKATKGMEARNKKILYGIFDLD